MTDKIRIFFGSPGCGKTTLACKFLLQSTKNYDYSFGCFPHSVPNAFHSDFVRLGEWSFPQQCYVVDDEAGISFNSRKTLSMPQKAIAYFKKHRHHKVDMDFFSQSWEDVDVTLRRLCTEYWYMMRMGPWTLCRRVYKYFDIDPVSHQPIDGYRKANMLWLLLFPLQLLGLTDRKFMLTYRPFYYRYFDSWEVDPLPIKYFDAPVPEASE